MKRKLIYLTILILIFLIFKNYTVVLDSTITAVELWLYKVFPYLFIMIILNDILINLDFEKLFKNPSIYALIMSLLSGSPTSAVIISNLYKNNKMDKKCSNKTLLFTYFANPLFLYTMLNTIFKSNFLTIKLMIIHYLSNIIIYIIFKNELNANNCESKKIKLDISSSIKKAINTTTMVLGCITFYLVICDVLNLNIVLRGILEMTQGLNSLINANVFNKEILAILFISFGGFSIHTQVKCILDETNLEYKYFFKGRVMQTIIAIILTCITQAI